MGGDSEQQIDALADYVLLLGYQKGGGKPVSTPGDMRFEPAISPAPAAPQASQEPVKEGNNAEKDS
ncbi:hypothetical protein EBT16_13910 [bacterium]|nr:hypothetical protein [bacterium]